MPTKVTIIVEDIHEQINIDVKAVYYFTRIPAKEKVAELASQVWTRCFDPSAIKPSRRIR
jgi:hypothetical protein